MSNDYTVWSDSLLTKIINFFGEKPRQEENKN